MKANFNKFLAVLIVSVMVFTIVPIRARAATTELAAQINAISGLFADATGSNVTVTGTNESITSSLLLNIPSGISVNWEATYTGAVSPASASMITVGGSGTFNVRNYGTVENIGTGNTLNITGSGTTVRVYNEGTVQSARSGSAILISANNVEVDIGRMGSVISLDGNANAAIQIGGGAATLGTVVNINNGSVISIGTGFAINDGAGTALLDNDTTISVTGGVVTAGGNSAIHSTGIRSAVTVTGGVISNAAGNNLNPAIDMQGDMTGVSPTPAYNITIGGSAIVQSTSLNGYAVQTKGSVLVQENALVAAINGRAINLVGLDSVARIEGGAVETIGSGSAGSGSAISTATTNLETVVRASVEVTGGNVSSVNGSAITVTGAGSKVTVSGNAVVSTTSSVNHAINATGTGATIEINGDAVVSATATDAVHTTAATTNAVTVGDSAMVSSGNGRAVYSGGAGSGVIINDTCRVWVWNTGNAIYCRNGTVTVNSGFVFAYGVDTGNVINAATINTVPGSALIVAWNKRQDPVNWRYYWGSMGTYNDIHVSYMPDTMRVIWDNEPVSGSALSYSIGANEYFFPIPEVSVYRRFGLIFDSSTGFMYRNIDGTGDLSTNTVRFYTDDYVAWESEQIAPAGPYKLIFLEHGFSWITDTTDTYVVLAALTIVGSTEIEIRGDSRFESIHPSGTGIKFDESSAPDIQNVTFSGSSTLTAVGSNSPGIGLDVRNGMLTMDGSTFIAQGGRAINWEGSPTGRVIRGPSINDYVWRYSKNHDGSDSDFGYGLTNPFEYFETDKYVMFRPVQRVNLRSAVQLGGISHVADSVAIVLTFSSPVSGLTADDIEITDGSGQAVKGILSGSGNTWILTLNRVDAEGTINVRVNQFVDEFYIEENERDNVQIYKAETEEYHIILTKTVQPGGDFNQLFEFEVFSTDDPRSLSVPLIANPDDTYPVYVTFKDGSPLPAERITGAGNNILLIKHNEAVMIHELPVGNYYVREHANQGLISAFNINSEGWFTAPDGSSREFMLTSDIVVDCFNSIVPEVPGEPERPFDPENPEVPPDIREESPPTGVSRNTVFPAVMLIFALVAFTGAEIYRRRMKRM